MIARVSRKTKNWYIRYTDADGVRREVAGFTDKEATRQLEAKLKKEAELTKVGVIDRYAVHRTRPIQEHLEEFRDALQAKGNCPEHVATMYQQAGTVLEGVGVRVLDDVSPSRVQQFLRNLVDQRNV